MVVRPPAPSATPVLVATLVANPVSVDTSKSYALVPLVATALATTSVTGWSTFLICALAAGETACGTVTDPVTARSEEHTSEVQSRLHHVCRSLLEKKKLVNIHTLPKVSHARKVRMARLGAQ